MRNRPRVFLRRAPSIFDGRAFRHLTGDCYKLDVFGFLLTLRACGSGEMANTLALGASAARLAGSSPAFRTIQNKRLANMGCSLTLIAVAENVAFFEGRSAPFSERR